MRKAIRAALRQAQGRERWFDKLTVRLSLTVLSSAEWTTLSESRRESNGDGKEAALELQ